jgi:hypothetical protein
MFHARIVKIILSLVGTAMLVASCDSGAAVAPTPAPATAGATAAPPDQPTASAAPAAAPTAAPTPEPLADGLINLTHLNFLSEEVVIGGEPVILTHIYSEAPNYEWVDASGEGIAAVDDVARAAIVYLDFYQATGNARALERARGCLNFVRSMQAEDGEFYNFVTDRQGTINREGPTSYKSMTWWAFRGMWALARGYAVLKDADAAYAGQLRDAYLKAEEALARTVPEERTTIQVHGMDVPGWLPGGAADASAIAALALAEYQAAEPNQRTAALLTSIADGLAAYQLGGPGEFPFAMHPDTITAPGFWHDWGSHQAQALARAGQVMRNRAWVDSAAREARIFYAWQLAAGRIKELGVMPIREGQIAYGTNAMVQGLMSLYHASGDAAFARMGGLAASWFFGNNLARTPMYDPTTGRGYDGIDAALKINYNAGAESTIEALMALQAVSNVPEAARYLRHQAEGEWRGWQTLEAENAREVAGEPLYGRRGWTGEASFSGGRYYELRGEDAVELEFSAPAEGDYLLYAAHMRRAAPRPEARVEATPALDMTIDGRLDEWAAAPPFAADRPEQILRGAQSWRGPETDSFRLRAMWDTDALYLAAEVRDTAHRQTGIGPGVASQDALWIYLDAAGKGRRLTAKLTLAQTPEGPQVWDWKAGFALPNAKLAWREVAGGYVYEAALPWGGLGAREAQAGAQMGVEVGRGFGGNSFLDLSGRDPDSAANLVPLRLVERAGQAGEVVAGAHVAGADAVALGVALDGGEALVLPQQVSPDRDYLWLDLIGEPIRLDAGQHTLRLTYAGRDASRSAIVDAFLLAPALVVQRFAGPDGAMLTLSYDMRTAELSWEE